jgi:hypothetical protein
MQHENTHPATRTTDRMQPTACNLQTRRHATDIHMQTDKMQREFTVCNRPDATCSIATRNTHTRARGKMQHAKQTRCNRQSCSMQHANQTGCNVATWNFGLQHATCEAHNGGCSRSHAAGATDGVATDNVQLATPTACNGHTAIATDDMQQQRETCNRQRCNLHGRYHATDRMQHATQTKLQQICNMSLQQCNVQHCNTQQATAGHAERREATHIVQPVSTHCEYPTVPH